MTKRNQNLEYIHIRSFLFDNVSVILDAINARKNQKTNQALDLFQEDHQSDLNGKIPFVRYKLKNKYDVLCDEKNSLGIYVSGNPLEDYQQFLEWLKKETFQDDLHLVLVEKIRKIFTKKGGMMLALTLTSTEESLEGLIFPKNSAKYSAILEEKSLYWVYGKINQNKKKEDLSNSNSGEFKEYEEQTKIIIDYMVPFKEGVLGLFSEAGITLADNRQEMIKEKFRYFLNSNGNNYVSENMGRDFQKTTNITNQTDSFTPNSSITIKLKKIHSLEFLRNVKRKLYTNEQEDGIKACLEVETSEGFKRSKRNYWIKKSDIEFFQKLNLLSNE